MNFEFEKAKSPTIKDIPFTTTSNGTVPEYQPIRDTSDATFKKSSIYIAIDDRKLYIMLGILDKISVNLDISLKAYELSRQAWVAVAELYAELKRTDMLFDGSSVCDEIIDKKIEEWVLFDK